MEPVESPRITAPFKTEDVKPSTPLISPPEKKNPVETTVLDTPAVPPAVRPAPPAYRKPGLGSRSLQRKIDRLCSRGKAKTRRVLLKNVLESPTHILGGAGLGEKEILLSFDDGPRLPHTAMVLDMLHRCGISAHFFLVGRQAVKPAHQAVIRFMQAFGHQVGSHTFRHIGLGHAGRDFIEEEIDRGHAAVEAALEVTTPFFRLPFGSGLFRETIRQVLRERNLVHLFWSLRSRDTEHRSARAVLRTVKNSVRHHGGGVLVLHERNFHTVRALPDILDWLMEEGFTFVTVDPGEAGVKSVALFPFSLGDYPTVAHIRGGTFLTDGELTPTIR